MFVLNARHVLGICDLLIERDYGLNIWAYARIDTVKDGMLDKLKRAGFNWLALGIEAADERVLISVDKKYRVSEIHDTVRRVKDAGINIIGNYIFGLPEDTRDTMQRTLDLALELNCEFANFYSAMAYPGSPLYEQALGLGWALPEKWSGYSQHAVDTLPLPTRHSAGGRGASVPRSRVRRLFLAPAIPGDDSREVRRSHRRAHPPDDRAPHRTPVRHRLNRDAARLPHLRRRRRDDDRPRHRPAARGGRAARRLRLTRNRITGIAPRSRRS